MQGHNVPLEGSVCQTVCHFRSSEFQDRKPFTINKQNHSSTHYINIYSFIVKINHYVSVLDKPVKQKKKLKYIIWRVTR